MVRSDASVRSKLTRAGFFEVDRAERFLGQLAEEPATADVDLDMAHFAAAASPDEALLGLLRLAEALRAAGGADTDELGGSLAAEPSLARRLIMTLGISSGLVDHLVRHPGDWQTLRTDHETLLLGRPEGEPDALRTVLLDSVGADPASSIPVAAGGGEDAWTELRVGYRRLLLQLVSDDAISDRPAGIVPEVARVLADMAAAALEAALAIARAGLGDEHAKVGLAVIGMGKTGGRELNYVSDVDVVYVAEPAGETVSHDDVREIGTQLAAQLAAACATPSAEPALWAVDAALRPEGKNGPLVKTLDEHRRYYDKWAESWEFQALLKARPIAGDAELGHAYYDAVNPLVWDASRRTGFVDSVRKMRTRVMDNIPDRETPRQVKLGPGGLRDVEFSAQLLQMVHGSADTSLQSPNTWDALEALKAGGYIGRDNGAELDAGYRFLRVIEHRLQLFRMRRTHLMPSDSHTLTTLARGVYPIGSETRTGDRLEAARREISRRIRALHQQIFYRPILALSAQLTGNEATLTTQEAKDRLAAAGYADPNGALRHLQALSTGVSRRAAIQRQLLPVLLEWLSDGVDPDASLLAFRKVSESLGSSHWYLRLLRDSGVAAERLTTLLGVSRKITELLLDRPTAVAWLDDDKALGPADRASIASEARAASRRHGDRTHAIDAVRGIYTREMLRIAIRDALGFADARDVASELTMITEACIDVGLAVIRQFAGDPPSDDFRFTIIAMGRLGGAEIGYASDADVTFVYSPGTADAASAAAFAGSLAGDLIAELRAASAQSPIDVDASLRPEGKNGPLARSLNSYANYFRQWSAAWESQAQLRARTVAGDVDLGVEYETLIEPIRYPEAIPDDSVRQVRRLKARMESERLPKNAEPARHLKLGRGGLSDVEWVAQLLQLQYAHMVPGLRTTSTVTALEAARDAHLISADDVGELVRAWTFASQVRDAMMLWRGRSAESLPTEGRDLEAVARLLGYPPGSGRIVEDDYLRAARHARRVMERTFYG